MTRSLTLKSEALCVLSADDLVAVHGAGFAVPKTLDLRECFPHTAIDCLTRSGCE